MEKQLDNPIDLKNKNEVPFVNLTDFKEGRYSIVKLSEIYPDFVIKEARTEWQKELPPGTHPLNDPERITQDTKAIIENFGEFVPRTQLIKGKNEKGEIVMYTIQEKVMGNRINELEYSEEIAVKLQTFFDKVIDNYIKNLFYAPGENEPRSFYPDLILRNFILGKTQKDSVIKLYYVDTYPIGGGTPSFVLSKVIPTLISRWPVQWRAFLKKYAKKFEQSVQNFISTNKNIPKQDSGSLFRK